MINSNILRNDEKAILALRELYEKYGYKPFKMSKFEEYEFYIQNKDFLVSDRIIAFNDTSGKLLALKPDVTLSIVKNGEDVEGFKQKVCYNENVYRVSENTHHFKEIMQTGVECIGNISLYDIYEMIVMATESLALISDDFVLEVSHLGLISSLLDNICKNANFKAEAIKFISDKNSHDLARICDENNVTELDKIALQNFVSIYGERNAVLQKLEDENVNICKDNINILKTLSNMLDNLSFGGKIKFDFSAVSDMNYYNGIVFKGFIEGIPSSVLSGGQYDKLMQKMNRRSSAIGFAVYLDELSRFKPISNEYDVDVLVVYSSKSNLSKLNKFVSEITAKGERVLVSKDDNKNIKYRNLINFDCEVANNEINA